MKINMPYSVYSFICLSLVVFLFNACKTKDNSAKGTDVFDEADRIISAIKTLEFPSNTYNIVDFGAVSDGVTNNSEAIKKAITACSEAGGGKVIIPSGKFLTGPIHLKSNMNLHLEEGAEVLFSTEKKDYLPVVHTSYEGQELMNYSPLIYAYKQNNIAVTGKGIFNGQASNSNWWPWCSKEEYGYLKGTPQQKDDHNLPRLWEMAENNTPVSERVFGDVTIAGQTAPGDGICLRDYPVTINADNVIIRYLRFRMGDAAKQEGDALGSRFHKNIIIDHCSMSWSTDETVSIYNNENTTLQWCFITESLRNSVHGKGAHGYGGIWGGKNASFHHNLLAHHDSRNPRLGEYAGSAFALTDLVDLKNNVIYNWGGNSLYGGEAMNVNIVNCYYKPGPATSKTDRIASLDKNKIAGTEVYDIWGKFYINGNFVEGSTQATTNNWTYGVYNQFHSSYGTVSETDKAAMQLPSPLNINNNVNTHTAIIAYDKVLNYGGASLARDAIDTRIVNEVKNKNFTHTGSNGSTNGIIDTQSDVGGWPELKSVTPPIDTSGDGMPDAWKLEKKLKVTDKNPNGHDLSTGYENIEVYINSLVNNITENQK